MSQLVIIPAARISHEAVWIFSHYPTNIVIVKKKKLLHYLKFKKKGGKPNLLCYLTIMSKTGYNIVHVCYNEFFIILPLLGCSYGGKCLYPTEYVRNASQCMQYTCNSDGSVTSKVYGMFIILFCVITWSNFFAANYLYAMYRKHPFYFPVCLSVHTPQ